MNKSLYIIEQEYLNLANELDLSGGELTPELESKLEIHEKDRNQKTVAYLEVIKSKESFNTRVDEEIKRLQALKKQNNNVVKRLKESLLNAVKLFGDFEVGLYKFGTRKSTSVEIEIDVNDLPKEYKVIKVSEQPDKVEIKKALKNGSKIDGCRLVVNNNLKIN